MRKREKERDCKSRKTHTLAKKHHRVSIGMGRVCRESRGRGPPILPAFPTQLGLVHSLVLVWFTVMAFVSFFG